MLECIYGKRGFRIGNVTYYLIRHLQKKPPELGKWAFLKRKPFEDEKEFRIIYESKTENLREKYIDIQIDSIQKITLSPWLPNNVAESVMETIKQINGCDKLQMNKSSLVDNSAWRKVIG